MFTYRDPFVLRGIDLDQQTQIGFCGTPLQVLHQQGYMVEEQSLPFVPVSSLLPEQTEKHDESDQDRRKKSCSALDDDMTQDAESNEEKTT